jgi:hypothetical protein
VFRVNPYRRSLDRLERLWNRLRNRSSRYDDCDLYRRLGFAVASEMGRQFALREKASEDRRADRP